MNESEYSPSKRKRIEPAGQKTPEKPPQTKPEKTVEEHFADLAKYREEQGMPVAGSPEDETEGKKCTAAKLIIGDKEFYSKNGHGLEITLTAHPIIQGHAEAGVLQQAKDAGIDGGTAVLVVDRPLCTPCAYGGVKSMLKQLGLTDVVVHSRGKPTIRFNPREEGNPFAGYHPKKKRKKV